MARAGAIAAVELADDGGHRAAGQRHLFRDPTRRASGLVVASRSAPAAPGWRRSDATTSSDQYENLRGRILARAFGLVLAAFCAPATAHASTRLSGESATYSRWD